MRLSWRERLAQQPSLATLANWPEIPADCVPRARRAVYVRNQRILAQALAGQPLAAVAATHGVSTGRVTQLLNRCLGGAADTAPTLTAGLIPHRTVVTPIRQHALPSLARPGGHACAFQALLHALPAVRAGLDA